MRPIAAVTAAPQKPPPPPPPPLPQKKLKLRSKGGCNNCRLRKRKCDEVRPTCGNCKRWGVACEWVHPDAPELRDLVERRSKQREKLLLEYTGDGASSEEVILHSTGSVPKLRIANGEDVRISNLLAKLFQGANMPCSGIGSTSLTVRTELHFASQPDSLSMATANAMAMVYWGSLQKDRAVLSEGLKMKGTSLAKIRAALSANPESFSGDLVAAVALARLFETMMPNGQSNWIMHAQGMAKLFEAIGPDGFRSPAMRRLVENNRWVMITSSSAIRRPCIFSSQLWKTVPWEGGPKDILQTLLDVYTGVPAIHAKWDQYMDPVNQDHQLTLGMKFVVSLRQILFELQEWRDTAEAEISASAKHWEPPPELSKCPWQESRGCVSFEQLHHAYALALFNMIVIVLTRYLVFFPLAANSVAGPQAPETTASTTGDAAEGQPLLHKSLLPMRDPVNRAIIAADEIARVMIWPMRESMRSGGIMYMGGPAHVCYLFYRQFNMERATWFETIMKDVNSAWSSLLLHEHKLLG